MEKVLVIAGPTGVGKTSLSVELAKACKGEVISGDSMQVYKEMSIGTAKITKEEMQDIPHYLIDLCSFTEEYNVKIFQEKAREYIQKITKSGKLPIICGGTGLYIKSCLYDYKFVDQKEDSDFMKFLTERSEDELWGMLSVIDPKACENLHPHNRQRIVRALAMAHAGEKKSEIVEAQEHQPVYDAYIIGLTMDRQRLYERINTRVDQMMKQGLLQEIEQLHNRYADVWELQSFQGIGYKEWKNYFQGSDDVNTCVESIKKNSRNFAKRQYTWFRNQMQVHWYDVEAENYKEQILNDVKAWMES